MDQFKKFLLTTATIFGLGANALAQQYDDASIEIIARDGFGTPKELTIHTSPMTQMVIRFPPAGENCKYTEKPVEIKSHLFTKEETGELISSEFLVTSNNIFVAAGKFPKGVEELTFDDIYRFQLKDDERYKDKAAKATENPYYIKTTSTRSACSP